MADQGLWFKLWCTAPSDPHISNLSLEDFARWCLLGVYMKTHGNEGVLVIPKPAKALQTYLHCDTYDSVVLILKRFPNCDTREEGKRETDEIVSLIVTWKNWAKYQGDYSSIRTARWRERERFKRRREEKRGEEKKVFTEPTLAEVETFAATEHLPLDAKKFHNHYAAKGWMVGRNRMKDWRAAARLAASDWAKTSNGNGSVPEWMRAK